MAEHLSAIAFAMLLGAGTLSLAACENDRPVENAGEQIEEAVDEAGDVIEDATL